MNRNPQGNTVITNAEETTADANGEFERFEALMMGLVETPKNPAPKKHDEAQATTPR